jgi:hypothetical protein
MEKEVVVEETVVVEAAGHKLISERLKSRDSYWRAFAVAD